jgi:hypothetical protein
MLLLGVGCAVMLAFASEAKALAIGSQHVLGQVRSATPEGDRFISEYVNFMIGLSVGGSGQLKVGTHKVLVTRSMNDFGSLPGSATLALRGSGTTVNLGSQGTYSYLFAHYGGPRGGVDQVWYVGDLSGTINLAAIGLSRDVSGWALFTAPNGAVPDGGTTAMLLGLAFGAVGMARRFLLR